MFARILKGIGAFLVYLFIAILGTWPLLKSLDTHLADHFGDGALHMWNTWWVGQAVAGGHTPFFTERIFYPYGTSLVTENFAWFHILPSLIAEQFVNRIAAFNVVVLLNLAVCGVAAYWVILRLIGNRPAAFVGGLIYLMWPYRLARLDLPNMLATYWIPLFLLFLIYSIERTDRRYAVMAGICLALTGYARWQFMIPAAIMGLIVVLFYLPAQAPPLRRSAFGRLVLAGFVAALLVLPAVTLILRDDVTLSDLAYDGDEEILMSADLFSFMTPSQLHATLSNVTEELHDRYYFDREALRRRPTYIGIVPLLLSIVGVLAYRRRAVPWVVMGLVMILLALGPVLRINGRFVEGMPTPYGLLSPLGILPIMRNPERFALFVAFPVAVLAASGTAAILDGYFPQARTAWLITGALSLLIFFEYYSPQAILVDRSIYPTIYDNLAADPEPFAVLNLPFDRLKAREFMGAQVIHQKAIVQGNLSRVPDEDERYINENAWLATLNASGEMAPEFADIGRQLSVLARDDIRYLLLHKDKVGADRIAHWQRALIMEPRFEDETLIAYSTRPESGRDFDVDADWENGLGPVQVLLSAQCVHAGHVLVVSIGWGAEGAGQENLDVLLALRDESGRKILESRSPLVDGWPTSDWSADTLIWGHYLLDIPPSVPAGQYELTAALLSEAPADAQGKDHILHPIQIQDTICNLAVDPQAEDANVLFGNELRLVEYQVEKDNDKLKLQLNWQAERFLDQDYSVFVHVFDQETDVPVAQDDGPPRDGAYALRHWWPGEVVDDRVTISLSNVPPGEYGIAIGVYDPLTGRRLPIVDQRGEPLVDDGRFVLPQQVLVP